MTTGASADPSAGCPSRLSEACPEDPAPSAFCSVEPAVRDACCSSEVFEDPPLPAPPQPTKNVATSTARKSSVNIRLGHTHGPVQIRVLPPNSVPSRQL